MKKHEGYTPGVWSITWSSDGDAFKIVDWQNKAIAGWCDRLRPIKEHEANAKLMADIPLLVARVEALEGALDKAIVLLEELAELFYVRPSEIEGLRQTLKGKNHENG